MGKFKHFVDESASGLMSADFSSLDVAQRMAQGKDIGEKFIIDQLAKNGIDIEPASSYKEDAVMKIDGYWNGEPVQIKLRRSGSGNQNDLAYEVLRNHRVSEPITDQLKSVDQQGRDWKGQVVHYFVLNKAETGIYHIASQNIKSAIVQSLKELERTSNGILEKPFTASNGVQLRPTIDRDPSSFTPSKVMAFIPLNTISDTAYPILKQGQKTVQMKPTSEPFDPLWTLALKQAMVNGKSEIQLPQDFYQKPDLFMRFKQYADSHGVSAEPRGFKAILTKV